MTATALIGAALPVSSASTNCRVWITPPYGPARVRARSGVGAGRAEFKPHGVNHREDSLNPRSRWIRRRRMVGGRTSTDGKPGEEIRDVGRLAAPWLG